MFRRGNGRIFDCDAYEKNNKVKEKVLLHEEKRSKLLVMHIAQLIAKKKFV